MNIKYIMYWPQPNQIEAFRNIIQTPQEKEQNNSFWGIDKWDHI